MIYRNFEITPARFVPGYEANYKGTLIDEESPWFTAYSTKAADIKSDIDFYVNEIADLFDLSDEEVLAEFGESELVTI